MKFLIVLVALVLLVWLLLGSARRRAKGSQHPADAKVPPPRPPPAVEGMVACVHCGVHLPSSQALTVRGQAYCSAAHRDADPRAP